MSLIEDCQAEHTKKLREIFKWAKNDVDKKTLKRIIRANRVLEEGLDEDATSGYRKLINDITDLPVIKLEKLKYFFQHYKDLENKHVDIGEWKRYMRVKIGDIIGEIEEIASAPK
jgi:hypothetical protein